MNVIVVKDADSLPTALFRANESAFRAANPHLDFEKLAPGAVVVVPDGVKAPAGSTQPMLGQRLDDVALAILGRLADAVEGGLAADTARGADLGKALGAKEVRKAASADPEIAAELGRLSDAISAQQQEDKDWAKAVTKAGAEWKAALDTLPK